MSPLLKFWVFSHNIILECVCKVIHACWWFSVFAFPGFSIVCDVINAIDLSSTTPVHTVDVSSQTFASTFCFYSKCGYFLSSILVSIVFLYVLFIWTTTHKRMNFKSLLHPTYLLGILQIPLVKQNWLISAFSHLFLFLSFITQCKKPPHPVTQTKHIALNFNISLSRASQIYFITLPNIIFYDL
jgi:hypothetical protein